MNTRFLPLILGVWASTIPVATQPVVTNLTTSVYAHVTDPVRLAFAPNGTLYVGRDNSGSGGDWDDPVKIHRVGPGGSPVEVFGDTPISDPDAVVYDPDGSASGIAGAVLVAGHELDRNPGKIVAIRPDQTLTTIYGPTTFNFNPNVFAWDLTGRLLFSEDEAGAVWTLSGGTPTLLFQLPRALHFAVDALNRIVIGTSGNSTLRLYAATGEPLQDAFAAVAPDSPLARGPGGFWGTGIFCVNTQGDLLSLDLEGQARKFGTGFGTPYGLAFGPDQALYVSAFNSDLIWRIGPSPCVPPPAGLLGWWPGDDHFLDRKGTNHATGVGPIGFQPGRVGRAFALDGSAASVQVEVPKGLPLGNTPRTLMLWCKTPRNLAHSTESALAQYGSEADGAMFGLITSANAPGRLYFFGHNLDLASTTPLSVDTWHHVAVTYDGTTLVLYLDGRPDGSRTAALNTVMNANGLTFGNRPGGAKWQGQLDEIAIFNRALAAAEIESIYQAGERGLCHQPIAPTLYFGRVYGHLQLSWASKAGSLYQLQSATALPTPNWQSEGRPFGGTGGLLLTNVPLGQEPQRYFRLLVP